MLMDIHILKNVRRRDLWEKQKSLKTKTWQLTSRKRIITVSCLLKSHSYYLITLTDPQDITEELLVLKCLSFSFNKSEKQDVPTVTSKTKIYQILQNIREALQEKKGEWRGCHRPIPFKNRLPCFESLS